MQGPFTAKLLIVSPFKIEQSKPIEFGAKAEVAKSTDINAAEPNAAGARPVLAKRNQFVWVLAVIAIVVAAGIMLRRGKD